MVGIDGLGNFDLLFAKETIPQISNKTIELKALKADRIAAISRTNAKKADALPR